MFDRGRRRRRTRLSVVDGKAVADPRVLCGRWFVSVRATQQEVLGYGGMGHTAGIHTRSREAAVQFGAEMPASRITVNTPTTHGAIGFSTALPPSMTLGCGSWGGNVTSDNVSPLHLMDIKRVAFETRPVKSVRPAVGVQPAVDCHKPSRAE